MNIKPLIAFFIVIIIAGGLLIAQDRSLGGGSVTITAQDMEAWLKTLPPQQLQGMSNEPEAKKAFVDNLKEMFILSQEAEKMGLANAPDAQNELSMMEKVTLAGTFRNIKGAENTKISEEEKQEYLKKSPKAFDEFVASSPRFKTIPEAQRETLKVQFAELMILLDKAKKAGIEKDPAYQMMYKVQRASYLAIKAQQQLRGTIPVSDEEIDKEFQTVKENYAETRARHILVMFPDQRKDRETPPAKEGKEGKEGEKGKETEKPKETPKVAKPTTPEESLKLAQELLTRIKDKKEDFAELAKQYSDDPGSGQMGGDLGYFKSDVGFVPEFKEVVFKLKSGEVSELVKTQFGYHIIQVTEKRPAPEKPDEPLKLELKDKVIDKKLIEKIDGLKAKSTVTIDQNFTVPAINLPPPAPAAPAHGAVPPPQAEPPGHEGHGHGPNEADHATPAANPETGKETKSEKPAKAEKPAKTEKSNK